MIKFFTRSKKVFENKDWVCLQTITSFAPILVGKNVDIGKDSYRIEDVAYLIQNNELIVQVYLEGK